MKLFSAAALSLCVCLPCAAARAEPFAFDVDEPGFRVTIPSVPAMAMEVHPEHEDQPHMRYVGSEGRFSVAIMTPESDPGMSVTDCAEAIYATLPTRPDVPAPDKIYRAKLDDSTFVAIYATVLPGFVLLHAHLLSASKDDHCIEVHASMSTTSREDASAWFEGFTGAKIEAR